jgi:hypothetical protein
MTRQRVGSYPEWLSARWEASRQETAERVVKAIDRLKRDGRPVTLSSICAVVKEREGTSISPATIARNDGAREAYLENRSASCRPMTSSALVELRQACPASERGALQAKVARLRKETKDELIARLIESEAKLRNSESIEAKLRDEIITLSLRQPKPRR